MSAGFKNICLVVHRIFLQRRQTHQHENTIVFSPLAAGHNKKIAYSDDPNNQPSVSSWVEQTFRLCPKSQTVAYRRNFLSKQKRFGEENRRMFLKCYPAARAACVSDLKQAPLLHTIAGFNLMSSQLLSAVHVPSDHRPKKTPTQTWRFSGRNVVKLRYTEVKC